MSQIGHLVDSVVQNQIAKGFENKADIETTPKKAGQNLKPDPQPDNCQLTHKWDLNKSQSFIILKTFRIQSKIT